MLNRRSFIRNALLASISRPLMGQAMAQSSAQALPPSPNGRIVIVGAGISGLVAADELMRSGRDVIVLEARARVGGRIHTLRDRFADNLYAEAGAYDFGESCTQILKYMREFKLPIHVLGQDEHGHSSGSDVYFLEGKRIRAPAQGTVEYPFSLTKEERKLGLEGLWAKYFEAISREIGAPGDTDWPNAAALGMDSLTINQYLRTQGASPGVIALFSLSFLGEGFELESAAADLWWQHFLDEDNRQPMTIRGGNDQLPKAIAQRLGQRIHFGAELHALRQTGSNVILSVRQAGRMSEIEADRVVLTLPFSMLRQVDLGDSFSPGKRRAIEGLRYTSQTHIYMQSRTRFWRAQGLSGSAVTDLPMHVMGDVTEMQAGSRGILMIENAHRGSQVATALSAKERLPWAVSQVRHIFPEIDQNLESGTSVAWDQEPWSMGGCAYYAPGELTTLFPLVARAEGRVHFAGEHTARIFTMEGAAESGYRAAHEVLQA